MRTFYAMLAAGLYTASLVGLLGLATNPLASSETTIRLGTVHVVAVEAPAETVLLDREIR